MKLPARSVAWLPLLLLTACFHTNRRQPVQELPPEISDTPKSAPAETPKTTPDSEMTVPNTPPPTSDVSAQTQQTPKPVIKPKKPVSRNEQQAGNNTAQSSHNTQQAANGSPGVSAIGQLSSGDHPDLWRETVDSITATERGLNEIHRTLSKQEQKTAAQIREFLKQAKEALSSGDVDGAHTLAAKAKLLLSEFSH